MYLCWPAEALAQVEGAIPDGTDVRGHDDSGLRRRIYGAVSTAESHVRHHHYRHQRNFASFDNRHSHCAAIKDNAMRTVIQFIILLGLASALGPLTSTFVTAQEGSGPEVGINYQYVHTNAPPGGCGCFSMNGGTAWFAYKSKRSLAAVAELSTESSSNV